MRSILGFTENSNGTIAYTSFGVGLFFIPSGIGYFEKALQMIYLEMHRKKRISHFFQTMIYDPFYDDLCEVSIGVHALNTYG